jgi:site-specific DNA recombinase
MKEKADGTQIEPNQTGKPDQKLLQSIVRAHAWLRELSDGTHAAIESLATAAKLHPKVVRQALRLAFLTPEITQSILHGEHPAHFSLTTIPNALALDWAEQRQLL